MEATWLFMISCVREATKNTISFDLRSDSFLGSCRRVSSLSNSHMWLWLFHPNASKRLAPHLFQDEGEPLHRQRLWVKKKLKIPTCWPFCRRDVNGEWSPCYIEHVAKKLGVWQVWGVYLRVVRSQGCKGTSLRDTWTHLPRLFTKKSGEAPRFGRISAGTCKINFQANLCTPNLEVHHVRFSYVLNYKQNQGNQSIYEGR